MPTWGEILKELHDPANRTAAGTPDFDGVRRRYLADLHNLTGRNVFLYASGYLGSAAQAGPDALSITLGDKQGFMEVIAGTTGDQLDLIIHSPGGYAEAAESIVSYLRTRFVHIRAFIPLAAMSAATMMALGADEIVLGKHSQLGPIDPQFTIQTPDGPRGAPAKAILDQFERAKRECVDPQALPAWLPILRSYGPGLLTQCENSRMLAESMVTNWLEHYMFGGRSTAAADAARIAAWFANYDNFASHSRAIGIDMARAQGLNVTALEADQALQDAVLSVFHATTHTFNGTGAVKIIDRKSVV